MFFWFILIAVISYSPAISGPLDQDPRQVSWNISASKVIFDNKKNLYIARDEVVLTGGKTRLEADYVEFSNQTKDAHAKGNVLLISGEDSISCNEMQINLATETGTIKKGIIYIQENNFYINGETIRKTGEFSYSAEKGSITSCSGDNPDWKITGKKIKVTVHGYGTATNTILWAKNIPTLYSPYLVFPVKTERQTGLLFPRVTSSDRKGFEYEQPLFLALSRNTDATLYVDHMSDRGIKIGTEYRYILDDNSKGTLFFDHLDDRKIDDGTEDTSEYSYDTTSQRTNSDRYWFRMKNNMSFLNGFTAKLDIDYVSDADYLLEFKNDGFTSFEETDSYFEKEFARDLDEYDDTTRKNWFNLRKQWSAFTLNIDTIWYDNVEARQDDTDDTTLQTLPAVEFDASRQEIFQSGLYYTIDSEFRAFYRQDTTDTKVNGQRLDLYPKFYYPLKLGTIFNFEPYLGLRQTLWYTDDFTDDTGNNDKLRTRQMVDLGAALSTTLLKIYNPENKFADKLKHEIIPKLEWDFTPEVDQDELPYFDKVDSIDEENLLTWSITQNFVTRKDSLSPESNENKPVYRDIAYFKVYQSYDIKKEQDNDPEPFSNISLDAELSPHEYFSMDADFEWSPYESDFEILNIGSTIKDNRGDKLNVEYRFEKDEAESLYSRIDLALTDEIKTYYSLEKNLLIHEDIETQLGLRLEKACWTLNLYYSYSDTDNDKSIGFLIHLHGIGEIGNK